MTQLHAKAVRARCPSGHGNECVLHIDNSVPGILHLYMSEKDAYIDEDTLQEMLMSLKEDKNGH